METRRELLSRARAIGGVGAEVSWRALEDAGLRDFPPVLAHLLAQFDHESAGFRVLSERFNRNADEYFRRMYGHRRDLGNMVPEDGPRFRGRGFIQITGRFNYQQASRLLGVGDLLLGFPTLAAASMTNAALVSIAWLALNWRRFVNLPRPWSVEGVTRIINGGLNGIDDRRRKFQKWSEVLGINANHTSTWGSLPATLSTGELTFSPNHIGALNTAGVSTPVPLLISKSSESYEALSRLIDALRDGPPLKILRLGYNIVDLPGANKIPDDIITRAGWRRPTSRLAALWRLENAALT